MNELEQTVCGMILTAGRRNTRSKPDRSAMLSNTNSIPNGLGLKPDLSRG